MEYTIENACLRATVSEHGAELISLVHKKDGVEHIWCGDPAYWKGHAPILFPHTGRLVDQKITAKGQEFPGKPHGFARNLEHRLVSRTEDSLVMELVSGPETRQFWPYEFRLVSTYRLEGQTLLHTLTVENTDEEDIRFGIGYHPGFTVPFDSAHTYEDYELRFSQPESPICLFTETTGLVENKFYYLGKNVQALPLDEQLFAHDSHLMTGLQSQTLGLYEKDSDRAVIVNIKPFPYTLIWSHVGKPHMVCIEPWHSIPSPADGGSDWDQKPAAAILAPGAQWSTTLEITFRR